MSVVVTYTHAGGVQGLDAVVVCGNGVSRELRSDHAEPKCTQGAKRRFSQKTDISSMPPIPEATSIWPH